jgi:hypothetical protein
MHASALSIFPNKFRTPLLDHNDRDHNDVRRVVHTATLSIQELPQPGESRPVLTPGHLNTPYLVKS